MAAGIYTDRSHDVQGVVFLFRFMMESERSRLALGQNEQGRVRKLKLLQQNDWMKAMESGCGVTRLRMSSVAIP